MIGEIIFVLAVAAIAFCLCHRSVENQRTASDERIKLKELDYNYSIEGKRIASNEKIRLKELEYREKLELKELEYKHKLEPRKLDIEEWKQQLDFHQAIIVAQIKQNFHPNVLYKPPLPVNAQLLRTQPPPYAA